LFSDLTSKNSELLANLASVLKNLFSHLLYDSKNHDNGREESTGRQRITQKYLPCSLFIICAKERVILIKTTLKAVVAVQRKGRRDNHWDVSTTTQSCLIIHTGESH
jgi:hypothetical protein